MTSPSQIELVIRMTPDGQINVSGPIHNKLLCYGLLEVGRDLIKDHVDKATRSAIVPVRPDQFLVKRPNGNGGG